MQAPAVIIVWGGRRSTQMAASTTNKLPTPTPSARKSSNLNLVSSCSKTSDIQEPPEEPRSRSSAATTSRRPSLTSGCRMNDDMPNIVAATEGAPCARAPGANEVGVRSYVRK